MNPLDHKSTKCWNVVWIQNTKIEWLLAVLRCVDWWVDYLLLFSQVFGISCAALIFLTSVIQWMMTPHEICMSNARLQVILLATPTPPPVFIHVFHTPLLSKTRRGECSVAYCTVDWDEYIYRWINSCTMWVRIGSKPECQNNMSACISTICASQPVLYLCLCDISHAQRQVEWDHQAKILGVGCQEGPCGVNIRVTHKTVCVCVSHVDMRAHLQMCHFAHVITLVYRLWQSW